MPHHVFGNVHLHHVAGADPQAVQKVEHRGGQLAIARAHDRERHLHVALGPVVHQPCGALGVGVDAQCGDGVGVDRPRVGQGFQRGLVELADQHDGVAAAGQRDARRLRPQLPRHPLVLPVNALHHQEQHRDGDHHQPGAVGELGDQHHHQHHCGGQRPDRVDGQFADQLAAPAVLGGVLAPVHHHARLAERERHEHAQDVQLNQSGYRTVEHQDQQARHRGQDHHAVAEHQPVAAALQLLGHEPVGGQNRGQNRKAVEGGVRGQHQNGGGEALHGVEAERVVAEHGRRELGQHRPLLVVDGHTGEVAQRVGDVNLRGGAEHRDAEHHGDAQPAHQQQRRRGVVRLRLAKRGRAVADRLDAGERGAARSERAQQQNDQRGTGGVGVGNPNAADSATGVWPIRLL